MTFERLDQLLLNAADVHRKAANLFNSLARNTENERLRMLLEAMAEQDERIETLILKFMKRSDRAILDTRIQYTLEIDSDAFIDSLAPAAGTLEISDIGKMGLGVHDYQVELLQKAMDEVSGEHVHELLDELLQIEIAERRNFSRKINSLDEM